MNTSNLFTWYNAVSHAKLLLNVPHDFIACSETRSMLLIFDMKKWWNIIDESMLCNSKREKIYLISFVLYVLHCVVCEHDEMFIDWPSKKKNVSCEVYIMKCSDWGKCFCLFRFGWFLFCFVFFFVLFALLYVIVLFCFRKTNAFILIAFYITGQINLTVAIIDSAWT